MYVCVCETTYIMSKEYENTTLKMGATFILSLSFTNLHNSVLICFKVNHHSLFVK